TTNTEREREREDAGATAAQLCIEIDLNVWVFFQGESQREVTQSSLPAESIRRIENPQGCLVAAARGKEGESESLLNELSPTRTVFLERWLSNSNSHSFWSRCSLSP